MKNTYLLAFIISATCFALSFVSGLALLISAPCWQVFSFTSLCWLITYALTARAFLLYRAQPTPPSEHIIDVLF